MTANILRDAEVSPLVREVSELRGSEPESLIRNALLAGWPRGRRTRKLEASIDLALSFRTWQSLVRGSGLSSRAASDLMATAIGCAAGV
jgi:hypothetical protein